MVTPEARKAAARHLIDACRLSKRRACRLVSIKRSVISYIAKADKNAVIRERMLELAKQKPRYGYKRLHLLLKREGFAINRKRIERLYRLEGLSLRRKRNKKRTSGLRGLMPLPTQRNEGWSMDFVSDSLDSGRRFRTLTIVDIFTKESPCIEVGFSLTGQHISRLLSRLSLTHGKPKSITVDNGPEFISKALNNWALANNVKLDFIDKGKPTQNAFIESFNGKFRDECLNQNIFFSIHDAKKKFTLGERGYNEERPHSSLSGMTPREFAEQEKYASKELS